jgi:hypothetical protein
MNSYLYKGTLPQFVTLLGNEVALQPNTTVDLPDCDYVQTLVAKGLLVPAPAKQVKKGAADAS